MVEVENSLMGEKDKEEEEEEVVDNREVDASSVPELLASLGLHQLTRFEFKLLVFLKSHPLIISLLELNGWDRLDKLEGLDRWLIITTYTIIIMVIIENF